MKKCYIIIVNYKRWEDTIACLTSTFSSTYTNFTVLVVDNNSNNNSLESIIAYLAATPIKKSCSDKFIESMHVKEVSSLQTKPCHFPDLVLIQNQYNSGFGAGNNVVLRLLLNEDANIWLLNPDMVVNDATLQHLTYAAYKKSNAIIGSVTKSFDKQEKVLFYGGGKINHLSATVSFITEINQIKNIDYVSGGSMFFHTSHLQVVGLLPEDYFLYWEETDWCYNAVKKGFLLDVCMTAVCYDKISTTIGRGFLSDYYYTRNGLFFLLKYKPWYLVTAFLAVFIRIAIRIFDGEIGRAKGMTRGFMDFLTAARYENK